MARPRTTEPTPRQRQIFEWVKDFIHEHRMSPTVREIGHAFGIMSSSVFDLLKALEGKGYMRRDDRSARSLVVEDERIHRPRGMRVLEHVRSGDAKRKNVVAIPILGTVAAGKPILAEENVIGEVLIDANVARGGRFFALEVDGDSMTGAGIQDGDTVVVRQQPLAESGDIVVAVVDGEATVKRLHLREDTVELRPENPAHQPIVVGPEDHLCIAGKVVAVKRADAVPS